jgi:predicted exporter
MTPGRVAAWLLALWLLSLSLLGIYVVGTLRLSGDLRLFLPGPASPEQKLVLEGIGEGPASRLLLIALDGGSPETLADISQKLVDRLHVNPAFRYADNGSAGVEAIPEIVASHRYLLSPAMDRRRLDAVTLREALEDRLHDLSSPAAPLLERWIPADPTFELLSLVESWAPRRAPRQIAGVWFDAAGRRALLVAQTGAAGFDPEGQQKALAELDTAFEDARGNAGVRMAVSGPGRFSALMKERTQSEATWLGSIATVSLLLLLFVAYRRPRVLLLAALPIASAALAGLACVSILYGEVHGITLAFGFTLIGVAQDYPIHLFSHQHRGLEPLANARALWPTLATGVASTCVAYLAFLTSGVTGLAQLAWFTITGLAVAGLTTRYLLPRIMSENFKDPADSVIMSRLAVRLSLPAPSLFLGAAISAACLAVVILAPAPFWEDDLGKLTPIPRPLLEQDARLRAELGAPDARYLAVISSGNQELALQMLEEETPQLEALVSAGAIESFDHAARYLPSARTQMRRREALPTAEALTDALDTALRGLPFRGGVFEPFLAAVARTRELPPLTLDALRGTPLAAPLEGLLDERDDRYIAIVAFSGVSAPERLERWAATAAGGVTLIDLKRAAVGLVVSQRERMLWCLAVAAALLVLVVRIALGGWHRAGRVLAPMSLTTLAVVAILRALGQPLDLFHLISLVLAAGLGLDYALYFERAGEDREERLRTLHAVLVSAISTLLVFVLLSLSSIPVLRSIGVTVTLGVFINFLLALCLPAAGGEAKHGRH